MYRSGKVLLVLGLVVSLMLSALGCSSPTQEKKAGSSAQPASTGTGASASQTLKVGWVGPLEGVLANYGIENKRGVDMALEEISAAGGINGKKLEVIFVNSKFDSNVAVQAVRRLAMEDQVLAIIGDIASATTVAMVEETRKLKVPQVAGLAGTPKITQMGSPYIFRPYPSVADTYSAIAKYAVNKLGYKKFAFIAYNDEGGTSSMQAFLETLRAVKGEIVATEVVPVDAKDFRSTLTKLRAANPDVLGIAAAAAVSGLIAKQARELGWNVPLLGHGGYQAQPQYRQVSGPEGDGMVLATAYAPDLYPNPEAKEFVRKYKEKYNREPSDNEAYGYDQLRLIAEAIRKGGADREKIREALASMKDFPGAAGTYTFLPNGDVVKPVIIQKWENGKLVPIEVFKD